MADFKIAWAITSKIEAGYSNNSKDKGKETWRGITRVNWPKWLGWVNVDWAKQKLGLSNTVDAPRKVIKPLEDLLFAEVALSTLVDSFYKTNYWDPINLDVENSQAIANKVFDIAVNMGIQTAIQFYKESKNK
jgi:lysozyme family protein